MANQVELFAELSKLRREVARIPGLEEEARLALDKAKAADEWRELAERHEAAKREAHEELVEVRKQKQELLKLVEAKERERKSAVAQMEKAKLNLKLDENAREGQVKRARILQHELKETQEENALTKQQLRESEQMRHDLNRAMNHERALRLQELHRNFAMGGAKKKAEGDSQAMEATAARLSEELAAAHGKHQAFEATVQAQNRLAAAQDGEIEAVRTELELERRTTQKLRTDVQAVQTQLAASQATHGKLASEVSRLRREITVMGTTHSERSRVLDTLPAHRRRAQTAQALSDGLLAPSAGLQPSMLSAVTFEGPSALLSTTAASEALSMPATPALRSGSRGPTRRGWRSPTEDLPRVGRATTATLLAPRSASTNIVRRPRTVAQATERPTTAVDHPGSLYLGSGLGLRKDPAVSGTLTGGSAKAMLKKILAARQEDNNAPAPGR